MTRSRYPPRTVSDTDTGPFEEAESTVDQPSSPLRSTRRGHPVESPQATPPSILTIIVSASDDRLSSEVENLTPWDPWASFTAPSPNAAA